jgi:hypothetical protein
MGMRRLSMSLALLGSASLLGAQQLVIPGWRDPETAWRRNAAPVTGAIAYESGYPLVGHLLTGTQMLGTDLVIRSVFRYRDAAGHVHGRSWQSALAGFVLSGVSIKAGEAMAPRMVRNANARRVAEARDQFESARAAGLVMLSGLAADDTVRLVPAGTSPRETPTEVRYLRATEARFSSDGDGHIVRISRDSATLYRITSVKLANDDARRHAKGLAAGLTVGMVGGIAACVARFQYCFPYTAMWASASAGYYVPMGSGPPQWRSATARDAP